MEDNTVKISHILFMILMMGMIIIVGTYAWLSYRSNDTAMVLTIGEINNVQVTLSPYQIKASLLPQVTYTSDNYTSVTAINNSSSSRKIRLYYKINNIDSELTSSDFKYTIERSTDGTNYSEYKSGNFNGTSNGSELTILEENIPNTTTYNYKVYLWIDSTNSDQSYMQGKSFSGELRAEILSYNVTFDANGGIVNISNKAVSYGETYGDLPTPTKEGYTFKGWNGRNVFDIDNFMNTFYPYLTTKPLKTTLDNNEVWKICGPVNATGRAIHYMENEFELDTQYTFSFTEYSTFDSNGYHGVLYIVHYTDETETNITTGRPYAEKQWWSQKVTSTSGKSIQYIRLTYSGSGCAYIKDFQIEKGTEATTYEPYYITSSTQVVQNKDHTLTAIWEPNS